MRVGWLLAALTGCTFDVSLEHEVAPVDTDGDAILDADDNCPATANADQRDHDDDKRGDACDLCPHIAPASDDDDDTDGIGNACDPRAGMDTLVVFDGFYEDSDVLDAWVRVTGTWELVDGMLRQTSRLGGYAYYSTTIDRAYFDYAYTAITVGPEYTIPTENGPRTIRPSVGSYAGANESDDHGYGCAISKDPNNNVAAWSQIGDSWNGDAESWNGDLVPAERYRVVQSLATMNDCAFHQGTSTSTTDRATLAGADGTLVIYNAATSGAYDYMFIVAIGP